MPCFTAMALDYALHALDLLDVHLSHCVETSESALLSSPTSEVQQPKSSARLHYLAARLFMSMNDPLGASVHLKIASSQANSWPSLQLSIQRALLACADRHLSITRGDAPLSSDSVIPNATDVKDACIEIALQPEKCKMLSPNEANIVQEKAWANEQASVTNRTSTREVRWTQYDTSNSESPFEFGVSFFESTHATSGDSVSACVSIKSSLNFPVIVNSIQLITSSGLYEVQNLDCCTAEKSLHRFLREPISANKDASVQGVSLKPNDLKFFLTELSLPSNLSDVLVGDTSSDISKFTPKNCRLSNMGFSHAGNYLILPIAPRSLLIISLYFLFFTAGNICESRIEICDQQNATIDGKPIPISSISKASSSLLGGIPLVCSGVVLSLKHVESDLPIKLQIERPGLFTPLFRSGALKFLMEESNYTSHSWSRPVHHPLCLGPRILRVLGPRPQLHVTNLTCPLTDNKLVKGTVNRIIFRLDAGKDVDCLDLRVKLKSTSSKKQPPSNELAHDSSGAGGSSDGERHQWTIFVCKAVDPNVQNVTEDGVALPVGWELRKDIGSDDYHDATTSISHHLGAGQSFHFSLDVFHPLDPPFSSSYTFVTSYEATFLYRQVRVGKRANPPNDVGDQVMVIESGSFEWISPFAVEFSQMNGIMKPFPCGIHHASNMVTQTDQVPTSAMGAESVAADGERIQMRFSLAVKALGSQIAANILRVSNEVRPRCLFLFVSNTNYSIFCHDY